jgi:hypothetical protein
MLSLAWETLAQAFVRVIAGDGSTNAAAGLGLTSGASSSGGTFAAVLTRLRDLPPDAQVCGIQQDLSFDT